LRVKDLTLIITELRRFGAERGIAMASDTAITHNCRTVDGLIDDRAFFGLIKLLPVQKLNAGISYWGWAKMPPSSESGVWMDWWLKNFLVSKWGDYNSIPELAVLLERELRKIVPPLSEEELKASDGIGNGGIHLTGFVEYGKDKVPCFWHIHNGISQVLGDKIDPHIVNANYDCPPQKYLGHELKGEMYQTRNGDYESYARFFDKHLSDYCRELYSVEGYIVPIPTVDFAADFLRIQIKFISGIYSVAGIKDRGSIKRLARGIGGNVTTLTISKNGIQSYKES
jgi:hypothetical protein